MDSTISDREKQALIKLLERLGVTVAHWGQGACMIKVEAAPGVYTSVPVSDLHFEEKTE